MTEESNILHNRPLFREEKKDHNIGCQVLYRNASPSVTVKVCRRTAVDSARCLEKNLIKLQFLFSVCLMHF